MQKDMNKIFEYKGYTFNIKVELYQHFSETGVKNHRVSIRDTGIINWVRGYEVRNSQLTETISKLENEAMVFVDSRADTPDEVVLLTRLGFS